jgi:hypothetical protein
MEKILTETPYNVPYDRWVELGIDVHDQSKPVYVKITKPEGFESTILNAFEKRGKLGVAVHKMIGRKFLKPKMTPTVTLKVYQEVTEVYTPEPVITETAAEEKQPLNPEPIEKEQPKSLIQKIMSGGLRPKDYKSQAVEEAQQRKDRLTKIKEEVNESSALKPIGLDGLNILTGDDCDYSRGLSYIPNLIKLEDAHNKQSGITGINERKLLCEFYNLISFSGIEIVIGMYIACGNKTVGKGSLSFLKKWYKLNLSKIYYRASYENFKTNGKRVLNKLKFSTFQDKPNSGLSIKQAGKVISELFRHRDTGEELTMKDLHCEVYQPLFLDDKQTRVYSRAETPDAKIVDVILNTGLSPRFFQSRKIEIGSKKGEMTRISLGPVRRSFDLPIAMHNKNINIVSFGATQVYQESKPDMEGINVAESAFLDKSKNYHVDYQDTKTYMEDHSSTVSYLRIESGHVNNVLSNSILIDDLVICEQSSERSTTWSNVAKTLIEWR